MSTTMMASSSGSPQVGTKRRRAHDAPKRRVIGGFIDESDSNSDSDEAFEPVPKRRITAASPVAAPSQKTINTPPDSSQPKDESHVKDSFASLLTCAAPSYRITTCSGESVSIRERKAASSVSYQTMVAARSKTKEGRAVKSYYGIDIHELIDAAAAQTTETRAPSPPPVPHADRPVSSVEDCNKKKKKQRPTMLWTEKYRARNFTDLVGDDLTNRQVLHWLKGWDPVVFPQAAKKKKKTTTAAAAATRRPGQQQMPQQQADEEKVHRKMLMLTGPPGLGKTTLAHVCARQAGYDVLEINASDDRSRDVVRGRIRTSLGTETVKAVGNNKNPGPGGKQTMARPVCVVVDEVDGAVSGSAGTGEGGFVKALMDLVMTDQTKSKKKKKGDDFRQMRPLVLICNDIYHPSLRPLRQSGLAEIIHVGKPPVEAVVSRLKSIFDKEGIPCEKDAARRLCEAAWGMTTGIDGRKGATNNAEGDLRGVMVVGEWVAGRLRATTSKDSTPCLTRSWVEKHVIQDLAHGGGGARGLGRGGTKEMVQRIFQEGAGFPRPLLTKTKAEKNSRHELPRTHLGFDEQQKKYAMARLAEMLETSGDVDRVMTGIFSEYADRDFNDDSFLTKPDQAYEWLHFHDACSLRIFSTQEWELAPYTTQPALACHHLFASPFRSRHNITNQPERRWGDPDPVEPKPFSGPRADYEAHEATKANRATLQALQARLPASLGRSFRSPEHVAADFLPWLARLAAPDVHPVVVGALDERGVAVASVRREAEKVMVRRAAAVLAEVGIELHRGRLSQEQGLRPQWVYRMEPDIDGLSTFETAGPDVLCSTAPTRYAVRQVLDQELQRNTAMREKAACEARFRSGPKPHHEHDETAVGKGKGKSRPTHDEPVASGRIVKRDFFGRLVEVNETTLQETRANGGNKGAGKVWVTFHEGLNNAVRKPISLQEFLRGL